MKKIIFTLALTAFVLNVAAQNGGITPKMMSEIKKGVTLSNSDKAISNVLKKNSLEALSKNAKPVSEDAFDISNKVPSAGISDQESSGRCWLFSGLNVLRSKMILRYDLGNFFFSQNYLFFYDQLEKSNLFLQSVIDCGNLPMTDRKVEWLFQNPLSDGGNFCGVQDLVSKYGLVPASVMPESYNANNTSRMSSILKLRLRQGGLELRNMVAKKAKKDDLQRHKAKVLTDVYRILSMCLGTPPEEFEYTLKNKEGKVVESATYTPLSFYKKYFSLNLKQDFLLFMNDPSRPFYKTYTVDMSRHTYDGTNWTFLNVPTSDMKEMAIASIKDSTVLYFSCDVNKQHDKKTGLLSMQNYDYDFLLGGEKGMNKAERIQTFASASSHAMTLTGVDLDAAGKSKKWLIENSWGEVSGHNGFLVMTDEWFDEYIFRLVVEKRYVPAKLQKLFQQKAEELPAWDPLYGMED